MKINIELDKALEETEVLIRAAKMTEEVNGILKKLEEPSVQMISGFAGDTLEILEQADIIRVYAAKGKVYAVTAKGEYLLLLNNDTELLEPASDAALRGGGTAGSDAFRTDLKFGDHQSENGKTV